MNGQETKEIMEIVEELHAIKEQDSTDNPDINKLREIAAKAIARFPKETTEYELASGINKDNSVSIQNASVNIILNRLYFYWTLYVYDLINKYGEAETRRIMTKYNLGFERIN